MNPATVSFFIGLLASLVVNAAQEPGLRNVALSSLGAEIAASDFLGSDTPDRLLDGVINHSVEHRWHSDLSKPHPHWLRLAFPKAMPLRQVVLHASSEACFPTRVAIECRTAEGAIRPLMETNLVPARSVVVAWPTVVTDNLSIRILASNGSATNYSQLNALEVLSEVTEEQVKALARLAKTAEEEAERELAGGRNVARAREGARAEVSSTGYFGPQSSRLSAPRHGGWRGAVD